MIGRLKTAAEVAAEKEPGFLTRNGDVLRSMGAGAVGLGAGTVGGHLAIKGVDTVLRRRGGQGIGDGAVRWIAPLAMGGAGMAMGSWRAHQDEMMRRVDRLKDRQKG